MTKILSSGEILRGCLSKSGLGAAQKLLRADAKLQVEIQKKSPIKKSQKIPEKSKKLIPKKGIEGGANFFCELMKSCKLRQRRKVAEKRGATDNK